MEELARKGKLETIERAEADFCDLEKNGGKTSKDLR